MELAAGLDEQVPVLIVGGGGAGLTASMLLAGQGVEHLLVSARPQTSDMPKAHVLNQRAMEVLEDVGVAEAIAQRSTPAGQMATTAYYAGLAGPDPDYGRRLARLECWGAGGTDEHWSAASPWRQLNLPQIRLEPLLKARAEELSPERIRFGHELVGLEQGGEGVRATVRDNATGRTYVVGCQYLLGADGGRRVAGLVGVQYEGLGVVTQTATLHVSADFSPWAKDPDVLLRWIFSPQAGVMVVMAPMGPDRWGRHSEEWVIHLNYPADDPRAQSDAQVEADARQALGLPDEPMKIHKITLEQLIAVHGPLLFIESHGCCDNNAPMCFPEGEFLVGSSDVKIAEVAGCPYYVDARTLSFRNTGIVQVPMHLDIEPGYADGMSLGPPGSHFVVRPVPPTRPPAASDTPTSNQTEPGPR